MIVPTVHYNGTPRDALLEGYRAACRAVVAAIEAVAMTAPNGRDYYLQGQQAIADAAEEHRDRMRHLEAVRDELKQLAVAVRRQKA